MSLNEKYRMICTARIGRSARRGQPNGEPASNTPKMSPITRGTAAALRLHTLAR